MKRIIAFCLCILMFCCSCESMYLPDEITIDGVDYKCISRKSEMMPVEINFYNKENFEEKQWIDLEELYVGEDEYYRYNNESFDFIYAHEPYDITVNIYVEDSQYEDAVEYYSNEANFNYYCILGNVFTPEEAVMMDIEKMDKEIFDELNTFILESSSNPLSSFQTSADMCTVDIDDDNFREDELFFMKISKDGVLSSRMNPLMIIEEDLYYVYSYEFPDYGQATATVLKIPSKISDYFIDLFVTAFESEIGL